MDNQGSIAYLLVELLDNFLEKKTFVRTKACFKLYTHIVVVFSNLILHLNKQITYIMKKPEAISSTKSSCLYGTGQSWILKLKTKMFQVFRND